MLNIVRGAAQTGGKAALSVWRRGGGEEVGVGKGGDVTLRGDLAAEQAVIEFLKKRVGDFRIVAEETGEAVFGEGGLTFIVDPIDGSRNFKRGIPVFATSVAVANGSTLDHVKAAAVYAPALNLELYAEEGKGLYLNGQRVSPDRDRGERVVAVNSTPKASSLPHALALILSAKGVILRSLGSACLELSLVAIGSLDAYVDPWYVTRVVDVAAAVLLAKESKALVKMEGRLNSSPLLSLDERVSLVAAADPDTLSLVTEALEKLGLYI